jgi:hypothetical protein
VSPGSWTRDRVALGAAGVAVLATLLQWGTPAFVRVPTGLLLALVLPGVALTAALFGGRALSTVERLVLPPALSFAVLILGGLGIYALGVALNRASWTALTAGVTVIAGVATALWQRLRPAPVHPSVTETALIGRVLVPEQEKIRLGTAFWRVVPLIVAVVMLVGAGTIALRGANADHRPYTSLALVPAPDNAAHPGRRIVVLTIRCEEDGTTGYRLRVVGDNGFRQTFDLTLRPGAAWSQEVPVPPNGTVTADLFKGSGSSPYRTVYLAGTG